MRETRLHHIVRALGGEVYDQGRRANIPAPGHSRADRSVSLLLQNGRLVVHTFGDGDWRSVLDHLRSLRLVDFANGPVSGGPASVASPAPDGLSRRARRAVAVGLWTASHAIRGTLSERYARHRAVTRGLPGPWALRHGSEVPVAAYRQPGFHRPALLSGIQSAEGELTAVEITYLTPSGHRADGLRLPRKTVGVAPGGCAVRLDPASAEMLVAEGVFTTLSASERFGLPAWALLSTRNLRAWAPPAGVQTVLIAGDRGRDGEASAEQLRRRLADRGVRAAVELPPAPWGDWNEWAAGR
jgi:putative DNA primase/helicase